MSSRKKAMTELSGIFGEVKAEQLARKTVAAKKVQPPRLRALTVAEVIACEHDPAQLLALLMGLDVAEVARISHGGDSGVVGLERRMGRLALALVGEYLATVDDEIYGPMFNDSNREAAISYASGRINRDPAVRCVAALGS